MRLVDGTLKAPYRQVHHTLAVMGGHNLAHTQVLEDHHLLTFGGTQIDNQNTGENWVRYLYRGDGAFDGGFPWS